MSKTKSTSTDRAVAGFRDPRVWAPVALVLTYLGALLYAVLIYAPSDDTFIYLVYVKNLLTGNGLTFNGDKVQGFTSVLWTMMIWGVGKFGMLLPRAANLLSGISGLLALIATYQLGRRLGLSSGRALAAPVLLALAGDFAFYMGNGLETVFFAAMLTWALTFLFMEKPIRLLPSLAVPLFLSITVLARPEGALMSLIIVAFIWWRTRDWKFVLRTGVIMLAILAPIAITLKGYYGHWLPNTYYAKSGAGLANIGQGLQYLANFFNWAVVFLFAMFYIGLFRFKTLGPTRWALLTVLLVWVGNVTVQGGDNMVGFRALVPVMPLMYVMVVKGFEDLRLAAVWVAVALLSTYQVVAYNFGNIHGSSWNVNVKEQAEQWRLYHDYRKEIAFFLREKMEPGEVVALNAAGVLPYYSNLRTIDMLGLNNEYLARHGQRDRSMPFGHQVGDGEWVLEQKPDLILLGGAGSSKGDRFFADKVIFESHDFLRNYQARELPNDFIGYFRRKPVGRPTPPKIRQQGRTQQGD